MNPTPDDRDTVDADAEAPTLVTTGSPSAPTQRPEVDIPLAAIALEWQARDDLGKISAAFLKENGFTHTRVTKRDVDVVTIAEACQPGSASAPTQQLACPGVATVIHQSGSTHTRITKMKAERAAAIAQQQHESGVVPVQHDFHPEVVAYVKQGKLLRKLRARRELIRDACDKLVASEVKQSAKRVKTCRKLAKTLLNGTYDIDGEDTAETPDLLRVVHAMRGSSDGVMHVRIEPVFTFYYPPRTRLVSD